MEREVKDRSRDGIAGQHFSGMTGFDGQLDLNLVVPSLCGPCDPADPCNLQRVVLWGVLGIRDPRPFTRPLYLIVISAASGHNRYFYYLPG